MPRLSKSPPKSKLGVSKASPLFQVPQKADSIHQARTVLVWMQKVFHADFFPPYLDCCVEQKP